MDDIVNSPSNLRKAIGVLAARDDGQVWLMDLLTEAADEIERLMLGIQRACEEFHYLPHVNGAVSDSEIGEVRNEAGDAIDAALARLHPLIDRPLTERQERYVAGGTDE